MGFNYFLVALVLLFFAGCAELKVENIYNQEKHKVRREFVPKENRTTFTIPLRRFGRDLALYIHPQNKVNFGIYPIFNETKDRTFPHIKRIVLTSVAKMFSSPYAAKYFSFVDTEIDGYTGALRAGGGPYGYKVVYLGLEGSITEADKVVYVQKNGSLFSEFGQGKGETFPSMSGGIGGEAKSITLDLTLVNKIDNTLIPLGYTSNNVIIFKRNNNKAFTISLMGNSLNLGDYYNVNDAQMLAVRYLIEYSLIQLLGRVEKVPYWHCFGHKEPDDDILLNYLREGWMEYSPEDKIEIIDNILRIYASYYLKDRHFVDLNEVYKVLMIYFEKDFVPKQNLAFEDYLEILNESPFCAFPQNENLRLVFKSLYRDVGVGKVSRSKKILEMDLDSLEKTIKELKTRKLDNVKFIYYKKLKK